MKKYTLLIIILLLLPLSGQTQDKIYKFDWKKELVTLGSGVGLYALGVHLKNKVSAPTIAQINALNPDNLNRFDRIAINNSSANAKEISDVILYSSLSLPVIAYFIPKCRFEGTAVGLMAVEAILITNGLTNITKGLTTRYRPSTYNPNVDLATKLESGSRLSFFSGHTSVSTAMSFLMATVITDVHADMNNKFIIWTTAAIIPAAIGYFRFEAGRHFPTDVISGYAVGALVGYFIPKLHKRDKMQLTTNGTGLSLYINLN